MKDKILYEQSMFWLLRDFPDKFKMGFEPTEFSGRWLSYIEEQRYNEAVGYAKENKIRIDNPELLPAIRAEIHGSFGWWKYVGSNVYWFKEGDIFDFPEGLKVTEQLQMASSTSENAKWINTTIEISNEVPGFPTRTVAILSKVESSSPEIPDSSKPDFDIMAIEYYGTPFNNNAERRVQGFKSGAEEVWNDFVIPRDKTIAELKAYISERLDAEDRFDKAEKQWLAKYDELQAEIVMRNEYYENKLESMQRIIDSLEEELKKHVGQ